MTSQRQSIKSVAKSTVVWLKFKGEVLRSQILGVRGVLAGLDLNQSKANQRLNTNLGSIYHRLAAIPMSGYGPQFDPSFFLGGGMLRWT